MNLSREELAAVQRRQQRLREDQSITLHYAPTHAERVDAVPPRNKYNARPTEYNGRRYHSAAEAREARRLDLLVHVGELKSWRPQVPVVVLWPGTHEQVLRCRLDFQLTWPDDRVTYLEVKGYRVRDWALRYRILQLAGIPLEVRGA